jgi:hypothetical protein
MATSGVWAAWRRGVAVWLLAALLVAPCRASAGDDVSADTEGRKAPPGAIWASAQRLASAEAVRSARAAQAAGAATTARGPGGASLAEKLACLYLLVGGTIFAVYGPQEKDGGQWTNDGKSETAGGLGAIGLSFALLRDIRKKSARPPQP